MARAGDGAGRQARRDNSPRDRSRRLVPLQRRLPVGRYLAGRADRDAGIDSRLVVRCVSRARSERALQTAAKSWRWSSTLRWRCRVGSCSSSGRSPGFAAGRGDRRRMRRYTRSPGPTWKEKCARLGASGSQLSWQPGGGGVGPSLAHSAARTEASTRRPALTGTKSDHTLRSTRSATAPAPNPG